MPKRGNRKVEEAQSGRFAGAIAHLRGGTENHNATDQQLEWVDDPAQNGDMPLSLEGSAQVNNMPLESVPRLLVTHR